MYYCISVQQVDLYLLALRFLLLMNTVETLDIRILMAIFSPDSSNLKALAYYRNQLFIPVFVSKV